MEIQIESYNWGHGFHLHCVEDQDEHIILLFEHCVEIFDKPTAINDSLRNRKLVEVMLRAHGFTTVTFINDLVTKNELKKKSKRKRGSLVV
jgi:hypothetical protein